LDVPFVWDKLDDPLARERQIADDPPYGFARTVHGTWVNFMTSGMPTYPGLPEWPVTVLCVAQAGR